MKTLDEILETKSSVELSTADWIQLLGMMDESIRQIRKSIIDLRDEAARHEQKGDRDVADRCRSNASNLQAQADCQIDLYNRVRAMINGQCS